MSKRNTGAKKAAEVLKIQSYIGVGKIPPSVKRQIIRLGEKVCHGAVNKPYVQQSIKKADVVLVGETVKNGRRQLKGFLLAYKFVETYNHADPDAAAEYIHLDVMCSSAATLGTRMLRKLEAVARKENVEAITLDALPTASTFWVKQGFRHVDAVGACKTNFRGYTVYDPEHGYKMSKCLKKKSKRKTPSKSSKTFVPGDKVRLKRNVKQRTDKSIANRVGVNLYECGHIDDENHDCVILFKGDRREIVPFHHLYKV